MTSCAQCGSIVKVSIAEGVTAGALVTNFHFTYVVPGTCLGMVMCQLQAWSCASYKHGHVPVTYMVMCQLQAWSCASYIHGHVPVTSMVMCQLQTMVMCQLHTWSCASYIHGHVPVTDNGHVPVTYMVMCQLHVWSCASYKYGNVSVRIDRWFLLGCKMVYLVHTNSSV